MDEKGEEARIEAEGRQGRVGGRWVTREKARSADRMERGKRERWSGRGTRRERMRAVRRARVDRRARRREDDGRGRRTTGWRMMEASPLCMPLQSGQTESGLYNYGLSPHQLREGQGGGGGGARPRAGPRVGSYRSAVFSSNCVLSSLAFRPGLLAAVHVRSTARESSSSQNSFASHCDRSRLAVTPRFRSAAASAASKRLHRASRYGARAYRDQANSLLSRL